MPANKKIFLNDSVIAFDKQHRKTINFNISLYNQAVSVGKKRYKNIDLAKDRASWLKQSVVSNLAKYLEIFEKNAQKNGIDIYWARNAEEAVFEILRICRNYQATFLVKSKSMISEEIELNEQLEDHKIKPVETDLGEFIVQLAGEKPYHILTPAMHKSKTDVANLFNKKFNTPLNATPEELTLYVRKILRHKFTTSEIGVTGANFLVADVGGVALTENEGNGMMSFSFPKIHVVITGIEKIIPSINDLPLMFPLLSAHGTGQQLTVYNSLITGPRKNKEETGPEKMVVILLDNRRTSIAAKESHYEALKCIRCGACLNACPIYKNVGGYTYNTPYSGPIGSVITPFFKSFADFGHLSFACTVCRACTEVCPVKIPLHKMLLLNRKIHVEEKNTSKSWDFGMKAYEWAFRKRQNIDVVGGTFKNKLTSINRNIMGNKKQFPVFSHHSFSVDWKLNLKQ